MSALNVAVWMVKRSAKVVDKGGKIRGLSLAFVWNCPDATGSTCRASKMSYVTGIT